MQTEEIELNEIDQIVIRERLNSYFQSKFGGRQNSQLVNEIVMCDETIYVHQESSSNKKDRYDTHIVLKDDTLTRFLKGKTLYLRPQTIGEVTFNPVEEFYKFLVAKSFMHRNEVGRRDQKPQQAIPITIDYSD